ncbi:MAG: anti-sigma factor family protein [Planctomycetota bacterium]
MQLCSCCDEPWDNQCGCKTPVDQGPPDAARTACRGSIMTDMNDCQDRHEMIADLVLGELEDAAADEIRRHIEACESCRLLYEALTAEEKTVQSAFEAIDDRSRQLGAEVVAQFAEGSRRPRSEAPTVYRLWSDSPIAKRVAEVAAAAVIIIGVFVGLYHFGGSNVVWADVVEKFSSVAFFNASIYIREDVTSEPKQMELWMNRAGRARMRIGTQVVFGSDGKITDAFDIKTRRRVEADEHAVFFLNKISEADELSLDSIISTMFGGEMEDVTPLINPDAVISQDLVVFDVELPGDSPEWVRIWALRESRLPVRIRVWDPRDGDSTDVVLDYSREQADEFFDPNEFEQLISGGPSAGRMNLAYAFLKDPGGKKITPEDMFARAGSMPRIKDVGITTRGAVWVIAQKGRNRTSDDSSFYGFNKIEDDLGRQYVQVHSGHGTLQNLNMEIFVPFDYPFDERTPKKITLTCRGDPYRRNGHVVTGNIELTEWKQDELWPQDIIGSTEQQLAITLAWKHCRAKRHDMTLRLLETIEGEPEGSDDVLSRERIRLRMLLDQDKTDQALAVADRIQPLLEKRYKTSRRFFPDPRIFSDSLVAFVRDSQLDRARETWLHIKSMEQQLSPKLSGGALKRFKERQQRDIEECMRYSAYEMSDKAGLTVEQIGHVFDVDVKKSDVFKNEVFWDWNPEFDKPK